MSELEMKTEVEDFSDELSDEALDRAEGAMTHPASSSSPVADR